MTSIQGRRLPDTKFGELPNDPQPGDYWKYVNDLGKPIPVPDGVKGREGNLTGTVWGYYSPDGNGIGTLMIHTVRENANGTISVVPGDGSSNSILHHGARDQQWHGYVYNGVWKSC